MEYIIKAKGKTKRVTASSRAEVMKYKKLAEMLGGELYAVDSIKTPEGINDIYVVPREETHSYWETEDSIVSSLWEIVTRLIERIERNGDEELEDVKEAILYAIGMLENKQNANKLENEPMSVYCNKKRKASERNNNEKAFSRRTNLIADNTDKEREVFSSYALRRKANRERVKKLARNKVKASIKEFIENEVITEDEARNAYALGLADALKDDVALDLDAEIEVKDATNHDEVEQAIYDMGTQDGEEVKTTEEPEEPMEEDDEFMLEDFELDTEDVDFGEMMNEEMMK